MSDLTTRAADAADAVTAPAPVAVRRSLWGRLYHGETAIDFYGRRWWALIAAANAPPSIIASSEMLIVPAFSATNSPEAANSSTAAAITALT